MEVFAGQLQARFDDITEAPAPPIRLTATAGNGQVSLDWDDNAEEDIAFYNLYRSTTAGGPYSFYAGGIAASSLVDAGAINGTTYYYVLTAINTSNVESAASSEAAATPQL